MPRQAAISHSSSYSMPCGEKGCSVHVEVALQDPLLESIGLPPLRLLGPRSGGRPSRRRLSRRSWHLCCSFGLVLDLHAIGTGW